MYTQVIRNILLYSTFQVEFVLIYYVGGQLCTDDFDIHERHNDNIDSNKQAIIPQFYFDCNGRITGIKARVRVESNNVNYPSIQVWRPRSAGLMVYYKIGEVQLESDDQVTGDGDHQLATIILSDNNAIEVQSGDVVGYYHPPQSRYLVRTRRTNGYILYQFSGSPNSTSVNLSNADMHNNERKPLIQFSIGKCEYINVL